MLFTSPFSLVVLLQCVLYVTAAVQIVIFFTVNDIVVVVNSCSSSNINKIARDISFKSEFSRV